MPRKWAFRSIAASRWRGAVANFAIPNQMSTVIAALCEARVHNLLPMDTNTPSSLADSGAVAEGLARMQPVASYDPPS